MSRKKQKSSYRTYRRRKTVQLGAGLKWIGSSLTRLAPVLAGVLLVGVGIRVCFGQIIFSDYFCVDNMEIYRDNIPSILENIESYGIHSKTSIYQVNLLGQLKQKILANHPEFRTVVIKRVFPNALKVEIESRRPVAQIFLKKYYLTDKDGRILPSPKNLPDPELPIIKGLELEVADLKIGKEYQLDRLQKALALIEAVETTLAIHLSDVTFIDVLDNKSLDFYLKSGIQVKIGKEMFPERLKVLSKTLEQLNVPQEQVRYIDLRFDDPVIGPKQ